MNSLHELTIKPCKDCIAEDTYTHDKLGSLRARGYNLRMIKDLTFEEIVSHKEVEPSDWFGKVVESVAVEGVLQPILLMETEDGLILIDGTHRSWSAHSSELTAPVQIFSKTCGECTEEMFLESGITRTRDIGWEYSV